MNGIKKFAFGLMMLLLVSCTHQQSMALPAPTALPTPAPGKITVLNLMAPVAPAGMTNGSIYFTLQNGTDQPLHLQGALRTWPKRSRFMKRLMITA